MSEETQVVRILPDDKRRVEAQAIGKEPFPYALHRVIDAGLRTINEAIEEAKQEAKRELMGR